MEAYMNAKTCLTNILDHYRANQTEGNTIEVDRTVEVELASHGNYSHGGAQDHNASRPNITIEYTHHL
ncbi:hypothetical protein IscW_ISCW009781 [Ixodes scapularis]|uniref:Uncharacterized protein n=1 Tax=Ixodes scapularis TaxID=6945 RepID=B7PYT4_IXOSC|nr:hypothetical protein IscW_ISCW009781 [Ixodes scapularis]|eukprot:XP_002403825.1 hypothetical protein IscW_ISCW009781 [Ixodes scapularis]